MLEAALTNPLSSKLSHGAAGSALLADASGCWKGAGSTVGWEPKRERSRGECGSPLTHTITRALNNMSNEHWSHLAAAVVACVSVALAVHLGLLLVPLTNLLLA